MITDRVKELRLKCQALVFVAQVSNMGRPYRRTQNKNAKLLPKVYTKEAEALCGHGRKVVDWKVKPQKSSDIIWQHIPLTSHITVTYYLTTHVAVTLFDNAHCSDII